MCIASNNDICKSAKPNTADWKSIKWNKVNRHVTSLQRRIYHASKDNNKKKVRDLQRQLMRSRSALVLSIKKVTKENKGKFTPGIDGFKAPSDKARGKLVDELINKDMKLHRPKPAFRKYIPKKNGKLRSLGIPTIKDRIYQEIIRMALEPEWEAKFEATSYGFRPKRRQHDAISRIYYNIKSGKWCWVFEGDFKSCFDTLSHKFILNQIKGFPHNNLVKRFLEAGYIDNNVFHKSNEGTPQGGLLSPLLANIALHGMEETLGITYKKRIKTRNGMKYESYDSKGDYRMVRYADDFLIFAQTEKAINKIFEILEPYLTKRGLVLAEDKTRITHISDGFDFLGFNCRRYNDQVSRIKPSKNSINRFVEKIKEICKSSNGSNIGVVINKLNPVIRGTANYWRHVVSKDIFSKMDSYLWWKVYKFLLRLHPNKSKTWIKNRYYPFYYDGKHYGNWIATDPKTGKILEKMVWTPIKRYIMIKHDFSPYDKDKEEYFENRRTTFCF